MWPDYSDVPTARGSVGAMGWQGNQIPAVFKITKPYVYRGTGHDTLTAHLDPPPRPKAKPKPTPEEREAIRVNRLAARELKRLARVRKQERARRKRERDREARRRQAQWEREDRAASRRALPPPEVSRPADRVSRNPKPSPGWEPLTGADIDSLLEELNDD